MWGWLKNKNGHCYTQQTNSAETGGGGEEFRAKTARCRRVGKYLHIVDKKTRLGAVYGEQHMIERAIAEVDVEVHLCTASACSLVVHGHTTACSGQVPSCDSVFQQKTYVSQW